MFPPLLSYANPDVQISPLQHSVEVPGGGRGAPPQEHGVPAHQGAQAVQDGAQAGLPYKKNMQFRKCD